MHSFGEYGRPRAAPGSAFGNLASLQRSRFGSLREQQCRESEQLELSQHGCTQGTEGAGSTGPQDDSHEQQEQVELPEDGRLAGERQLFQRRGLLHVNLHPARTALLLSQQKRDGRKEAEAQHPAGHDGHDDKGGQVGNGEQQRQQQPRPGQLPWVRLAQLAHAAGEASRLPEDGRRLQPSDGLAGLELFPAGPLAASAGEHAGDAPAAQVNPLARPAAAARPSRAAAVGGRGSAGGGYDDMDSDEEEGAVEEEGLEGEAAISSYLRAQLRELVKVRSRVMVVG